MASDTPVSMAEELLNDLYIKPYTGMTPYLSLVTSLTVHDFEKSPLTKYHWLDFSVEENLHKERKKCDPNQVFEVFGYFLDHETLDIRQEMLSAISSDFNYYHDMSWLSLQMHKSTLSVWCSSMQNPMMPADESQFLLSQNFTTVILWCTLKVRHGAL